jgi:hypothetical protein
MTPLFFLFIQLRQTLQSKLIVAVEIASIWQEEIVDCSSDYSTRLLAMKKNSTMFIVFFDPRTEISMSNNPHNHVSKV